MNKKIIALILVISVLFLSGCKQETGTGTLQKDPFIGGTAGLLISFQKDAPPAEVFDSKNYPFDVEVKLKNEGETEVKKENVFVKLKGVDPAEFGLSPSDFTKSPSEDLTATKKDAQGTVIEGATTYVTFSNFNYQGKVVGNTQFPIWAEACYVYGTTAQAELCVKENLLSMDDKICKVNEKKKIFNSGAPVQISEFEESARGKNTLAFTFKIEHTVKGNVYTKGTKCDSTSRVNENKVWINVDTGIPGTDCPGLSEGTGTSGYVILYEGERIIRCSQPVSTTTDYMKPIKIELTYDYLDDISTNVIVKPVV
jgi:hypothetical protein